MERVHRAGRAALSLVAAVLFVAACDGSAPRNVDTERARAASEAAMATTQEAARKAAETAKAVGAVAATELKDASAKAAQVTTEAAAKVAEKLEDALITAKVTTGLAADKNLTALKIQVQTRDGVVTLKGPAPTPAARERAAEIARNVKGVTSVDNQLSVQSG